jgi:hypothetical protein
VSVVPSNDGSTAVFRAALDRAHLPYRARRFVFLTVFDGLPGSADPSALGL